MARGAAPAHRSRRPRPGGSAAPTAPDVRGIRTMRLRTNRLVNVVCGLGVLLAALLLLFGAYRGTNQNGLAGVVVCAIALLLGWAFARRLGPGRLLTLDVTGADVRWVNAFEPSRSLTRSHGLRAVLWISRRYPGATPKLRRLYLVDATGAVVLRTRPATFSQDRLERFFAAVALPVEVVDAAGCPFPDAG